MSRIENIGKIGYTPLEPEIKRFKQDAPEKGKIYSDVYRTGSEDGKEIIKKIITIVERKLYDEDKDEKQKKKQQQQNKQKQPCPEKDDNKIYAISSPVSETIVQPRKNGCASTCLAMLLRKYGLVDSPAQGYQKVEQVRFEDGGSKFLNDVGIKLSDIAHYARMLGLKARERRGERFLTQFEGLLESLNIGSTPIASIQVPGMGTQRHAVLVVGITQHKITIVDPAQKEIVEMGVKSFQKAWGKEDIKHGSFLEALSYVEVWGQFPQGEIKQYIDWHTLLEEFTRDSLIIDEETRHIINNKNRNYEFSQIVKFYSD